VIELTRGCSRYRAALIDFVDHGEVRPETAVALAHLDRCQRCTEVVESTIQTITALRRLGDTARDAQPADDAWPRLRARLQAFRSRRRTLMSPLAGLAMSLAIVSLVVVRVELSGDSLLRASASPSNAPGRLVSPVERQIETTYIASVRHVEPAGPGPVAGPDAVGELTRVYPDDRRPVRKEVGPSTMTSPAVGGELTPS
jgi:hypothetical protein